MRQEGRPQTAEAYPTTCSATGVALRSARNRTGVAVQNVERSKMSKVSGSCQKVSGSWRRLARRYGPPLASLEYISGPGCRIFAFILHVWNTLLWWSYWNVS